MTTDRTPWLENSAVPTENRMSVGGSAICPASGRNGYYICNTAVYFYDVETREKMALCAQTGCDHRSTSCRAYIGDVTSFTEYGGLIYAIVNKGENVQEFICKSLSDGTMITLDTWTGTGDREIHPVLGCVGYQSAVVYVTTYCIAVNEEDGYQVEQWVEETQWLYDLNNGEKQALFGDEGGLSVTALSENYLLAVYAPDVEGEFDKLKQMCIDQHGENASVGRYYGRMRTRELRLYDRKNMEYALIASQEDGLVMSGDPHTVMGDEFVYQRGDTIYVLNVTTGKCREVLTMDNTINHWLMDGKVFLLTQNMPWYIADGEGYELSLYYASLEDEIPVKLGNGGNTQFMEFSIYDEGESFFLGWWNGGRYMISKADFYADRYDAAWMV